MSTSPPPGPEAPIWSGELHIRGNRNSLTLNAVAHLHSATTAAPSPPDVSTWPRQLHCTGATLKSLTQIPCTRLFDLAEASYVRLVPVDANAQEIREPRLDALVAEMVQRRLTFEVPCGSGHARPTLYLAALQIPPHESSLFGVYAPPAPPPKRPRPVAPPTPPEGNLPVWRGVLRVHGLQHTMDVPCVALQYILSDPSQSHGYSLIDASGWPDSLMCDVISIRRSDDVVDQMNRAQWYVRFAPVDKDGREVVNHKLRGLVNMLSVKRLVFEVPCENPRGTPGTLYMWGLQIPPHGESFLGVFLPRECQGGGPG